MESGQFIDMIQTASWALLLVLVLMGFYVLLKRMTHQMRKGVELAVQGGLKEVDVNRTVAGEIQIRLALEVPSTVPVKMFFELNKGIQSKPFFDEMVSQSIVDCLHSIPNDAFAIVIEIPGHRIYRRLDQI
ncbi:MAG: hypothetical protein O2818_05745 [Bacteroidetes bacterium]|nr:hypothetical protein [Bacteroidota bacterium]